MLWGLQGFCKRAHDSNHLFNSCIIALEVESSTLNTQHRICHAEALYHALQQQTSLANSGCTLAVTESPKANSPNLAKASATGPSQSRSDGEPASDVHQRAALGLYQTAPARPKSPLLVMSSRGADLIVVSVQLKTGYLRVSCSAEMAQDSEINQTLKQVRKIIYTPSHDVILTNMRSN